MKGLDLKLHEALSQVHDELRIIAQNFNNMSDDHRRRLADIEDQITDLMTDIDKMHQPTGGR